MKQFDRPLVGKRVLFFAAVFYLMGILLANLSDMSWLIFLLFSTASLGLYFLLGRKYILLILVAIGLAGAAYFSGYMEVRDHAPEFEKNTAFSGRIAEVERSGNRTVYRLTEAVADGRRVGDIRLVDYSGSGFAADDIVYGYGNLKKPQGADYPFGFDNRLYMASVGIDYTATASDIEKRGKADDWRAAVNQIRQAIGDQMDELLGTKASLGKAIFLGMEEEVSDEVLYGFRQSGISHILCVSGLHVCIIAGVLSFLLKKININKRLYIGLIIIFISFYVVLVGLKPSAVRSGLMFVLYTVASYLARRPDTLTLLSAAFLAFSIGNPAVIYDPSFQLSFGAIFGILCISPLMKKAMPKKLAGVCSALGPALGATLGTAPITINLSNKFWLPSILLNVIVISYGSILIPVLFLATMLYCICPPLLAWTGGILQEMVSLLEVMSTGAELLPALLVTVKSTWGIVLLALVGVLFLISDYVNIKGRWKAAAALLIAAPCIFAWGMTPKVNGEIAVAFLNAGSGECALISTDTGKNVLIDTSNGTAAAACLMKQGKQADMTFITKLKTDHAGGLDSLMEEGLTGEIYASQENAELLGLKYTGTQFQGLMAGDVVQIDGHSEIQVVWIDGEEDGSMVLRLLYDGHGICIFMSDADKDDEKSIQGPIKSDIIKLGRNGRHTATSEELLEKVSPRFAAVTSSGEVQVWLNGIPLYDTKDRGTTTFTWKKDQIKVETAYEG